MKRWITRSLFILGAVTTMTANAQAQFVRDFQLNVFLAGSAYTRNNYTIGFPQTLTPISGSFRINEGIRGGVRTNVYSHGHWGQEFFYSFEPNQVQLTRRTAPESTLKLDTQIHNLGVNALYYFHEDQSLRVRPFVTFGLGATIYKPTVEARRIANDPFQGNLPDLDTSRELAFNYGAGVSSQLSQVFGLRADLRGFLGRNPTFGFARESEDPNAVILPATGAIHNLEVSAGIVFFFQRGR